MRRTEGSPDGHASGGLFIWTALTSTMREGAGLAWRTLALGALREPLQGFNAPFPLRGTVRCMTALVHHLVHGVSLPPK